MLKSIPNLKNGFTYFRGNNLKEENSRGDTTQIFSTGDPEIHGNESFVGRSKLPCLKVDRTKERNANAKSTTW